MHTGSQRCNDKYVQKCTLSTLFYVSSAAQPSFCCLLLVYVKGLCFHPRPAVMRVVDVTLGCVTCPDGLSQWTSGLMGSSEFTWYQSDKNDPRRREKRSFFLIENVKKKKSCISTHQVKSHLRHVYCVK